MSTYFPLLVERYQLRNGLTEYGHIATSVLNYGLCQLWINLEGERGGGTEGGEEGGREGGRK